MADEHRKPVPLDYREPDPRVERQWRRILFCVGLPLLAVGLARGFGNDALLNGIAAGLGAFLVAFVLPVP